MTCRGISASDRSISPYFIITVFESFGEYDRLSCNNRVLLSWKGFVSPSRPACPMAQPHVDADLAVVRGVMEG